MLPAEASPVWRFPQAPGFWTAGAMTETVSEKVFRRNWRCKPLGSLRTTLNERAWGRAKRFLTVGKRTTVNETFRNRRGVKCQRSLVMTDSRRSFNFDFPCFMRKTVSTSNTRPVKWPANGLNQRKLSQPPLWDSNQTAWVLCTKSDRQII